MFQSQLKRAARMEEIARALKLNHQTHRSFHCAGIFNKGLISLGWNTTIKTHRRAQKLYRWAGFGLHAEFSAVLKSKLEDFEGMDMFVVRIENHNRRASSLPCDFCQKMLKQLNFRKIFYSDYDGWKTLKL